MDHSTGIVGSQASACRLPAERARVLLEINNAIVSHLDLALVLKGVSDCLRREIKHDFAGLALYDADRHELRLHALDFPDHQDFLEKGQLIPLVGISFPILGDWGGPVTSLYGLTQKFDIQGVPMETARRATFLIDKSGKIINEQVDDEAVDPTKTVEACERQKLKN
jgi:hypothetical protein